MTVVAPSTWSPDLVRIGVTWSGDRSHLVLPTRVPLGELAPAVAALVGALDPEEVHRGCALLAPDGRVLDPETGLGEQGVRDGETVTLVLGLTAGPEPDAIVHDDLVDAVTQALVLASPPWGTDDSRWSRRLLGAVALASGALLLGRQADTGAVVGAAAAAVCVILLALGLVPVLRRSEGDADLLFLAAGPYAAVAGLAAGAGEATRMCLLAGLALLVAGGAALAVAGTPSRSQPVSRPLHPGLAPVVVWMVGGAFATLVGATALLTSLSLDRVVAVELAGLAVLGATVPRIVRPGGARLRLAQAGMLGVDLVLAVSAPAVVSAGGWVGLGMIGVCGFLVARGARVMLGGLGGSLPAAVVGASLAGPVVGWATALSDPPLLRLPFVGTALPPSLLPDPHFWLPWHPGPTTSVTATVVMVATLTVTVVAVLVATVVAPGLIAPMSRDASRAITPAGRHGRTGQAGHGGGACRVDVLAVVLLTALLVVVVGLVSPSGVS